MNALNPSHISVPITNGLSLAFAAGHDPKILELAMPHVTKINSSFALREIIDRTALGLKPEMM